MISRRYQLIFVIPLEIGFDWMRSFWFAVWRRWRSDAFSHWRFQHASGMVLICNLKVLPHELTIWWAMMAQPDINATFIIYYCTNSQCFPICVGRYLAGNKIYTSIVHLCVCCNIIYIYMYLTIFVVRGLSISRNLIYCENVLINTKCMENRLKAMRNRTWTLIEHNPYIFRKSYSRYTKLLFYLTLFKYPTSFFLFSLNCCNLSWKTPYIRSHRTLDKQYFHSG